MKLAAALRLLVSDASGDTHTVTHTQPQAVHTHTATHTQPLAHSPGDDRMKTCPATSTWIPTNKLAQMRAPIGP